MPEKKSPADYDGEESHELLTLAGMALFQAQIFEVAIANLAVALKAADRAWGDETDISSLFDTVEKETLGRILREVKKYIILVQSKEEHYAHLLARRNYLIHRFFRVHDMNHMKIGGRKIMAEELHEMINAFYAAHNEVEELYKPLWAYLGISQEIYEWGLNKMHEQAEEKWGKD